MDALRMATPGLFPAGKGLSSCDCGRAGCLSQGQPQASAPGLPGTGAPEHPVPDATERRDAASSACEACLIWILFCFYSFALANMCVVGEWWREWE